jgi:hypothetical protein
MRRRRERKRAKEEGRWGAKIFKTAHVPALGVRGLKR